MQEETVTLSRKQSFSLITTPLVRGFGVLVTETITKLKAQTLYFKTALIYSHDIVFVLKLSMHAVLIFGQVWFSPECMPGGMKVHELQPNHSWSQTRIFVMIVFVCKCPTEELHSEYVAGGGPLTAVVSPSQGLWVPNCIVAWYWEVITTAAYVWPSLHANDQGLYMLVLISWQCKLSLQTFILCIQIIYGNDCLNVYSKAAVSQIQFIHTCLYSVHVDKSSILLVLHNYLLVLYCKSQKHVNWARSSQSTRLKRPCMYILRWLCVHGYSYKKL